MTANLHPSKDTGRGRKGGEDRDSEAERAEEEIETSRQQRNVGQCAALWRVTRTNARKNMSPAPCRRYTVQSLPEGKMESEEKMKNANRKNSETSESARRERTAETLQRASGILLVRTRLRQIPIPLICSACARSVAPSIGPLSAISRVPWQPFLRIRFRSGIKDVIGITRGGRLNGASVCHRDNHRRRRSCRNYRPNLVPELHNVYLTRKGGRVRLILELVMKRDRGHE